MNGVDDICDVALLVKGDHLDPDLVTKILGTSPTEAHVRGAKQYSEEGIERPYSRPTGFWAITFKERSSVSKDIAQLSRLLRNRTADIGQIEGVEEFGVDLFFCATVSHSDSANHYFEFSESDIKRLHDLKVPVQCAVTFIREDGASPSSDSRDDVPSSP